MEGEKAIMHIKNIVDYVKNEIHFSREFCEDNVFVTLRIEPIERIIENLEQKDKDNLSYTEDLAKLQAKANKYDILVENIKEYANWHKEHLTEDIEDYIDDDKVNNADIIGELKEEREHWKDIFRILNNEKTYINYKNY